MSSDQQIRDDITQLQRDSVPMEDILVNDGLAEWGETCATTRQAAGELIEEWGKGDTDELQLAQDWLDDHDA